MPPTSAGWSKRREPLPAWVEATGMPVASANSLRASSAALWWTPPPAMTSGRRASRTAATAAASSSGSGAVLRTTHSPLGEELLRPVVGLRLHVLRQGQRDGAGVGGVGEDPHRGEGGGDQRLGAGHAVEVLRDGPQAVVDRHVARVRHFELLEHRVGGPGGEDVAGQEEDRQPVDGGERGARDEVGGAGPDGRGDGVGGQAAALPGVPDGGVHHGLFVAPLMERHVIGVLDEGLPDARHIAVAEDAPGRADQPLPHAVPLGVLAGQEAYERLRGGEPDAGSRRPRHR